MNNVNPFVAPFELILLSKLFIAPKAAFEAILLTNPHILSIFKLPNQELKDPPD